MSDPNDTQAAEDLPVEGTPVDDSEAPVQAPSDGDGRQRGSSLQDLVDEPAKVMRIGTMIRQLLEEVKSAPLDDAARGRLAAIHERSIKELEDGLAPELVAELDRISLPLSDEATPSDAELRIAQAQLVGWLEGLFHGIQTAIAAQNAAREHAAAQLQLRQLPPGTMIAPGVVIGENGEPQRAPAGARPGQPARPSQREDPDHGPGQYL
ncbi:bacterial proteasome activator family protein [Arthrobacter sp. DNA4]|uniref:bacterial proteasome activator family protein n=1 Tax=Micrococcaceae TaxID=1268 RepID=UPI0020CC8E06|nr:MULTISPECIES: bacterial proteasome activator family protein [Micrococcaceae]UTT70275.1 bacterial proteasome activator family protein [Arthrobacter sp. DNA4]WRT14623.1 bacterial proteasome activator family protein [Pseudarthrobacter sp. LT1]